MSSPHLLPLAPIPLEAVPETTTTTTEHHSTATSTAATSSSSSPDPSTSALASASMPPPSVTVTFAAPPVRPTYTLKQLLAYQLQMPSPPSGASVGLLAAKINRPTHSSSSAGRAEYECIHLLSLRRVPNVLITSFRARLETMNSIRFDQPMALPWNASPMMSEGCVTAYLDAQVLGAAWQAVLQMVPEERNYDLQMVKQVPVVDGIPDQTYSVLRGKKCEAIAVVELKSIGVVKGMLSVIENVARGVLMDPTDDWKAVTRQLRKYAASSNIHDVLVLDEQVGIYFRFPHDPFQVNEGHDYLHASTDLGPDFGDTPRLSLRELVVFAILSALDRHNVELRDFAAETASPITVGPNTRPYHNVLPGLEPPPPDSKKRPRSSFTQNRRQGHKRGKKNGPTQQDTFDKWDLGAPVKLEFIPEKSPARRIAPPRARASSLDSGFCDGTDASPHNSPPKPKPPPTPHGPISTAGTPTFASVSVQRILKKNVALVTDGASQFIAKLFPPDSDCDPRESLKTELAVYAECASLQGTFIPYLHGIYRVADSTPLVMLTEYIGSGTTVEQIIEDADEIEDDAAYERVVNRLAMLQDSAVRAVQSLHALKVVHADIAGRNMVVTEEDQVVLVDFGRSVVVKDNLCRFRARRDEDLALLRKAFVMED